MGSYLLPVEEVLNELDDAWFGVEYFIGRVPLAAFSVVVRDFPYEAVNKQQIAENSEPLTLHR